MGLGIVVFVHELGHFVAARLMGIKVEAFAIGWGKTILKKKIGDVEYRISAFPVGGYCKMSGENDFEEAWKNHKNKITPAPGSYYTAGPLRRIVSAFSGPLFNILFAIFVFTAIWGIGFSYETMENRIVIAEPQEKDYAYPAEKSGLKTGDRIVSIDSDRIDNFQDIRRIVSISAEKPLNFEVERGEERLNVLIEPELQDTGAGMIGVLPYTEPVIGNISEKSPAEAAGLLNGDRIKRINGRDIPYTAALNTLFSDLKELPEKIPVEYERNGESFITAISVPSDDTQGLGISWKMINYHTPHYGITGAVKKGFEETFLMLKSTLRGFKLLFHGSDITKSVSGPIRITWMAGEIATEGFGEGFGAGIRLFANFLALISIALGATNLLPLPILDGGAIILFIVEAIKRGPLNPKIFAAFQTAGIVIIAGLMLLALTGDILFFVRN